MNLHYEPEQKDQHDDAFNDALAKCWPEIQKMGTFGVWRYFFFAGAKHGAQQVTEAQAK